MTTIWVSRPEFTAALEGLPGITVEHYEDGTPPDSIDRVEFYVPMLLARSAAFEIMARMPSLRVVQLPSAGYDQAVPHVPPGVVLCNARGAHDAGTAEWAAGAIIASRRDFFEFAAAQESGRWTYHPTGTLADSRVLIVGYGSIGAALERRLQPFEVEITRVASRAREGVHGIEELPALLPAADIVVLLVPATPETKGMIDAAALARMSDGALLVNAARGSVVDTEALLAETAGGRLRAALDVTDPEPLPAEHPLWRTPGVFITPHVGGSTPASNRRIAQLVREQVIRFMAGEPLRNVVSLSAE